MIHLDDVTILPHGQQIKSNVCFCFLPPIPLKRILNRHSVPSLCEIRLFSFDRYALFFIFLFTFHLIWINANNSLERERKRYANRHASFCFSCKWNKTKKKYIYAKNIQISKMKNIKKQPSRIRIIWFFSLFVCCSMCWTINIFRLWLNFMGNSCDRHIRIHITPFVPLAPLHRRIRTHKIPK